MKPLVTAHTGCEKTCPNSIASFLEAVSAGADFAELDIRATIDRTIVLSHDDDWLLEEQNPPASAKNPGVQKIPISKTSLSKLEGITQLEEIIAAAGDKEISLNLDIKDFSCIDTVFALLKKFSFLGRAVFSGFTFSQVKELKKIYPVAGFMVNISADFTPAETLSLFNLDRDKFVDQLTEIYRASGGICLNINHEYSPPEIIEDLRKRFVPVSVWTIDNENLIDQYSRSDAYSITTSKVRRLVKALNR